MTEDNVTDMPQGRQRSERLQAALREARQTEAERQDVIVDLREAEIARLELLQDALEDVFADVPPDNDLLECTLHPGSPPRLWVDVLAHVTMGRDKRTYRFVKDTRYGRQTILETANLEEMADRITAYVAHRIIERQRALESDDGGPPISSPPAVAPPAPQTPPRTRRRWTGLTAAFLFGGIAGAAALFGFGLFLISS